MTFWKCYYHIVWATHNREPLIHSGNLPIIFEAIKQKCEELDCHLFAVNAVADHIHIAVAIPPKLSIADFMRHTKGITSREVNTSRPSTEAHFRWQRGYGVLTFGANHLKFVVRYIKNQPEHHATHTAIPYMETIEVNGEST